MSDDNTNVNHSGGNNDNGNGGGEKWYSEYSEDLHEHIKDYESAEAMAKSHVELRGKVPVVPEKPEGYNYKHPEDGPEITNQEQFNAFINGIKEAAHQAGLTQTQFEAAVKGEIKRRDAYAKNQIEAAKKAYEAALQSLKTDWGDKFDENMKKADRVATAMLDEKDLGPLKKAGVLNAPWFAKMMLNFASKMSEDVFERGEDHQDDNENQDINPLTGKRKLKYNNTKYE